MTKKLEILSQGQYQNKETVYWNNYLRYTVCITSKDQLYHDECRALLFGLDHHIPSKTDSNLIYTEFECYY